MAGKTGEGKAGLHEKGGKWRRPLEKNYGKPRKLDFIVTQPNANVAGDAAGDRRVHVTCYVTALRC